MNELSNLEHRNEIYTDTTSHPLNTLSTPSQHPRCSCCNRSRRIPCPTTYALGVWPTCAAGWRPCHSASTRLPSETPRYAPHPSPPPLLVFLFFCSCIPSRIYTLSYCVVFLAYLLLTIVNLHSDHLVLVLLLLTIVILHSDRCGSPLSDHRDSPL